MADFSSRYKNLKGLVDDEEYFNSLSLEQLKKLHAEAKETQSEYKNLELIVKRDANSLYGTAASIYFSLCDFDVAEDITSTGRHYAVLVDRNINKFFVNWGEKELKVIQQFYPQVTELRQFTEYKPDTKDDICVYGDTDSRYLDIFKVYELIYLPLPESTEAGDKELADFTIFLMDNFINNIIKTCIEDDLDYRNGNKGFLKMAHEVTTRKCVFQAKKKYVMATIWKDGKQLKNPSLKIVGVELRKGELNKRIKKIIRQLIDNFMLKGYSTDKLREECIKLIRYIKSRKEKDFIYRITSVNGLKNIVKNENDIYVTDKSHIQMKIALSWYNFLEKNKLWGEYKPPFEGQKMNFYYDNGGNVIGVPDDINLNTVQGLPEPDWNKMLNQILIKSLLRYIYDENKISDKDIEHFLLNVKQLNFE